MADMNTMIIEAFRANDGVLGADVAGGHFDGKRVVLMHHVGRVSGTERVTPLVASTAGILCGRVAGNSATSLALSQARQRKCGAAADRVSGARRRT